MESSAEVGLEKHAGGNVRVAGFNHLVSFLNMRKRDGVERASAHVREKRRSRSHASDNVELFDLNKYGVS